MNYIERLPRSVLAFIADRQVGAFGDDARIFIGVGIDPRVVGRVTEARVLLVECRREARRKGVGAGPAMALMGDDIAEPGAVEGDRRIDIREQFGRMALDPARPETALLLAAMEEVEARTRGRDHAEHDPQPRAVVGAERHASLAVAEMRSEEHTSELQSLMRISYAVFCLKKKNKKQPKTHTD